MVSSAGKVLLGVAALLLFVAGGSRWAASWMDAPLQVLDTEGPTLVAVIQGADCPDRTAALARWLHALRRGTPDPSPPVRIAALRGFPSAGLPSTHPLADTDALLDPVEADRAERALLRSGTGHTPALLVLDGHGRPLLAGSFTDRGPDRALSEKLELLSALHAGGGRTGRSEAPSEEEGRWNR